jgi:hypothetical protein
MSDKPKADERALRADPARASEPEIVPRPNPHPLDTLYADPQFQREYREELARERAAVIPAPAESCPRCGALNKQYGKCSDPWHHPWNYPAPAEGAPHPAKDGWIAKLANGPQDFYNAEVHWSTGDVDRMMLSKPPGAAPAPVPVTPLCCTRDAGHDGPCNGWQRPDCSQPSGLEKR